MEEEKKNSHYFQRGNTYGVGKGRPPIDFTDEEVKELGEDLINFLKTRKEQGKPVMHYTEWYFEYKNLLFRDWDYLRNRKGFAQYYEMARDYMAYMTISNKELPVAYGSRFLALYSSDLRKHEQDIVREKAEAEVEAKKALNAISEEEMEANRKIVEAVAALQESNRTTT